ECCRTKKSIIEGFCHIPNLSLEFGVADAVVLNDGHQFLTLIYPLENKHRIKMEYYREKNLTRSELNIVSLLLEGHSNSQIMERLFISKATLKTHINNIYKKIPAEMRPRN
ncbi:MAG TPA: helix-turn-helix transcriptional regulator, partial [Pseudobdellovibrionaceae bacterium]